MAGFLDSKERVIDMVLTDLGKTLLLKGDLNFVYWIPFDDEVDYWPTSVTTNSWNQTIDERRVELTETPLIREASMGYRGLNMFEEDNTNVHRPMFTAPPGVGHMAPLPTMLVSSGSVTGTIYVQAGQKKLLKNFTQKDNQGNDIMVVPDPKFVGVQRFGSSEAKIDVDYLTGSYTPDFSTEGFLITMYMSSTFNQHKVLSGSYVLSGTGGFQEVIHTHNSDGDIAYRNDLGLRIYEK